MKSNFELKKVNIENCMCYNFNGIIKIEDLNLDNFLIYEKSH